jgi:hypothetical protein
MKPRISAMKFIFPLLISFQLYGLNSFANAVAEKDSLGINSGLIVMAGMYDPIQDPVDGYQFGGEVFGGSQKFQGAVQGFVKLHHDKPDFQVSGLVGRKINFKNENFGVFSIGGGCEFEKIVTSTLIYGYYGLATGIKTTERKTQYWGGKFQFEYFFKPHRSTTFGVFTDFFLGTDYQDFELGLSWMISE